MNRHRNRRLTNESIFAVEEDIRTSRSHTEYRQISYEESSCRRVPTLRRRSSFDEQTLERLRALSDKSEATEQHHYPTQKPMIRNYLRRSLKNSLAAIRQESTSSPPSSQIDNFSLFTDRITDLTRRRSENEYDDTVLNSEEQNPYLTYFYRSADRPNILNTEFFPVSSEQSIS